MENMNRDELARQARGEDDQSPDREQGEGLMDRARDAFNSRGDEAGGDRAGRPEFSSRDDNEDPGEGAPYTASSYTRSGGGDVEDEVDPGAHESSRESGGSEGGPVDPF